MSRVLIVCAKPVGFKLPKGYDYIGVEKGALYLAEEKIRQVYAIGDFDSVTKVELNKIKASVKTETLPQEKDLTDAEAAIIAARELGYKDISIYAHGPRLDHFVNMLTLVKKYAITFIDGNNRIVYLEDDAVIKKDEYNYISFITDYKVRFSATGLKWELEDVKLTFKDTYTTSNEIKKGFVTLNIKKGGLFVIQSND